MSNKNPHSGPTYKYSLLFTIVFTGLLIYSGVNGIKNGPSELEQNFPFRKQLITFFTEFRLILGDRVFQQAIIGNDGWLELTSEGNLDNYQNADPMNPVKLEKLQASLQDFYDELNTRNITLLVVIAPNKSTIYPDKIPAEIQKTQQESGIDTLFSYHTEHGPQVFIDLRPILLEGRETQQIYYRTDTHWNAVGAYYAYKGIIDELSLSHSDLQVVELTDFTQSVSAPGKLDISRLIGSTTLLETSPLLSPNFEINTQWITLNTDTIPASLAFNPDGDLPKAIIYHDSFGEGLKPYLSLHFSKALFVSRGSQQNDLFSYTFIDQFDPNIIIIEVIERDLSSLQFLLDKFQKERSP
jgi:hypothetical protein